MDSLERVSLAIILIVSSGIYFVYNFITKKNKALEVENEILRMKVKAYEVFQDVSHTTVDDLINDRNSKRDSGNT